jgi:hypothetical protein
MASEKRGKKYKDRQGSLEKSAKAIFEKAKEREKAGRDSFEAGCQAALEIMLLMMEKHLLQRPGQLLPMQIGGQDEWEFYFDIQKKLDLPPDTCAVLVTPSTFKKMPFPESAEFQAIGAPRWERNAYSIIISDCRDHNVIMQVSLPGMESVGIDVFEDGKHFADYTYNTIEECLNDLTKMTWIHFNPKSKWTEEQINCYTENWFAKSLEIDLQDTVIHDEYSYLHHPELLDLTPLESVFKVIQATIPKEYDRLEKAIEITNDLNRDFELGDPVVTKEGILQDKEPQCKSLLNRIGVEIDQHLDELEYLEGVKFPNRSIKNHAFGRAFNETAKKIYEVITGRSCPKSVNIG